ncbi:MAG: hypothetical protein WCG92_20870 [Hyphomicrobiales bacterium]|nr:hypothetical protein [Alphaproteobacteria bacterium]
MRAAITLAALAAMSLPFATGAFAKDRRAAAQPPSSADPRVACTEYGCGPVPSGCGKRPGIPGATTSARYDEVVCPPAGRGFRMR